MRFVLDARHAAQPGGFATYLRAIGSRLAHHTRADEQLRFWLTPSCEPLASGDGVTHHRVRAARSGLINLLLSGRFDALRRDDVFHAPANVLPYALPCRTVVTVHDILWLTHPQWCQPNRWTRPISRAYYSTGIWHALHAADRIITVSAASADSILQRAPQVRSRLHVIHNAADPEYRLAASTEVAERRARELLGFDAPYFIVVGLNQTSKGHAHALRGFAALAASSARLVFVQRVNKGGELVRLAAALGVADRVVFLNALPRADIIPLMQSARALVHPSLWEGFGIPPLEAMSVGCPVIASDIPAIREVVGSAGLLVEPASAPAITAAMQRICDDATLRSELRAQGLERARDFSWDKAAAQTLDIYREAAR